MASQLNELSYYAEQKCQPFAPTWWTPLVQPLHFAPWALTLLLVGVSFRRREVYVLLVSIGMTLDAALNAGLRALIAEPPPVAGCGASLYWVPVDRATPSMAVQNTTFFTLSWLLYTAAVRPGAGSRVYWLCAAALQALVALAEVYFHYASPESVVLAAGVGTLTGWLWHALLHDAGGMRWTVHALTHWWPLRLLGYGDTLYVIETRVTAASDRNESPLRTDDQ